MSNCKREDSEVLQFPLLCKTVSSEPNAFNIGRKRLNVKYQLEFNKVQQREQRSSNRSSEKMCYFHAKRSFSVVFTGIAVNFKAKNMLKNGS